MIGVRTSEALQVKIAGGWLSPRGRSGCQKWCGRGSWRWAGRSRREIANQLNAEGLPTVGGSGHRGTVIRVLRQHAATWAA